MKKYIFISIGGFFGAISRFAVKSLPLDTYKHFIPFDTLLINITGSFILVLFLTLALQLAKISSDIKVGISTGFLGAYTTFSTFCKETTGMIDSGKYLAAFSYIILSIFLGLAAAFLGNACARFVTTKFNIPEGNKLLNPNTDKSFGAFSLCYKKHSKSQVDDLEGEVK